MSMELNKESVEQAGANVGHGHVFPRADGVKMRCGGPGLCSECTADASRARAALAQPSPALPPFAEKVLAKLRRFYDCASDFESGGVDIGRHWLDLLTQLGLLNRVQRSPALWEISQQGEDLLGMPQPSPAQAEAERPIVSFEKYMQVMYDRDEHAKRLEVTLARVAELEHVLRVVVNAADHGSWPTTVMHGIEKVREVLAGSAPPAKAQHSVPDAQAVYNALDFRERMFTSYENVSVVLTAQKRIAAAPGKEGV